MEGDDFVDNAVQEVRIAIELLTAWTEPGPLARPGEYTEAHARGAVLRIEAFNHLQKVLREDRSAAVSGLIALNQLLLRKLARERGASTVDEEWRDALEILREVSAQLPDGL